MPNVPAKKRLQVMLVETSVTIGQLLRDRFQDNGYDAQRVVSASDAIHSLSATLPDCFVIGSTLKPIDGVKLIQELGRFSKTRHLPKVLIVAISPHPRGK